MITKVVNIDDIQVGHCMMIGAECNQVIKFICPAVGKGRYMVDMDMNIKTADSTAIIIAQHGLLFDESPFTALPVAVKMACFGIPGRQTKTIAIVPLLNLARELSQFAATMGTRDGNFIVASRLSGHSLPFDVALAFRASDLILRRPPLKRIATNGAGGFFFPAAIIAVMRAAMLVSIDVFVLAARILSLRDSFAATASAIYRLSSRFNGSVHRTIIHG